MNDSDCVRFLKWALPRLRMRWRGFRRVRRQVCKRVARRMHELGLPDAAAYRDYLDRHADEWERLDGLCRITISRFYRDRRVFEALGDEVLPALARRAAARPEARVRCWSAGCASGEEPYSLAGVWVFAVADRFPGTAIRILATDADEVMLERARRATWAASSLRELPPDWRDRGFAREAGRFRAGPALTAPVRFDLQDVRTELPEGPFDLVLCRNLAFTYFEDSLQREVLAGILARLAPGGALVIGSHEALPSPAAGLSPWVRGVGIFRTEAGP